jgi:hypothetical protein
MDDVVRRERQTGILTTAREEGLLGARDRMIGGRVPAPLVEAAKARSGIRSDSELLLYALSKVAIEDDFGRKLVARKGRLPRGVLLDV